MEGSTSSTIYFIIFTGRRLVYLGCALIIRNPDLVDHSSHLWFQVCELTYCNKLPLLFHMLLNFSTHIAYTFSQNDACCLFFEFLVLIFDSFHLEKIILQGVLLFLLFMRSYFYIAELCTLRNQRTVLSPRKLMAAMDYYIPNFNLSRQQVFVYPPSFISIKISKAPLLILVWM